MTAKPLEEWPTFESEPVGTLRPDRMAERHRRSVHREVCRPQRSRSPQRQFSPVKSIDAGGDAVNVAEASNPVTMNGEVARIPVGVRSRGMSTEKRSELGRPVCLLGNKVGGIN
jgi:hypothetical protein